MFGYMTIGYDVSYLIDISESPYGRTSFVHLNYKPIITIMKIMLVPDLRI